MSSASNSVRTAARAVVVRDGKLLAITMRDREGEFFILPGGGQRHGETLADTLRRETHEEIGLALEPGPMLYVREYIGKNHGFAREHQHFHQVEVVFRCALPEGAEVGAGSERDRKQIGVAWLELAKLGEYRFFPAFLKKCVRGDDFAVSPLYWGDLN
ncbi:MAG TPA: NUDIX domain-containing protein [Opitutales bacterium]|jgi:8-oxo-dGTP diphosphatase|nr:NUDIX domain-containing protein [Opitutales bacterium]